MNFSNLLSKVLDFVNLGKALVDGGPGVVLAVALSILAASVAELPIFPYTHGPVELVPTSKEAAPDKTETTEENKTTKAAGETAGKNPPGATGENEQSAIAAEGKAPEEPKAANETGTRTETGASGEADASAGSEGASTTRGSGSPDSKGQQHQPRLQAQLEKLGSEIRDHRDEVASLSGEKAQADAKVEGLKGEIQRLDTELEKLEEEKASRTTKDTLGFGRVKSEIEGVRKDREKAKEALGEALQQQSSRQNQLEEQKAEVDRFLAEFEALGKERITTLRGLFAYLLDHLVGLALIGLILGTMLSPLNRALLVLGTKGGLERQAEAPIEHYDQLRPQSEKLSSEEREGLRKLLGHRGASFFIGRKIISKSEWDGIVTSYYRWAEAANNLIIPLTVLGLSLLWLQPAGTTSLPAVSAGAVILLLAVLVASRGGFLFENDSSSTENGEVRAEVERKERRPIASITLLAVFIALALIAWKLYDHRYALGSVLCWLLAFVAWFQGRKAFFLYRRRGADFILGRLIATELAKKEKGSAQSLEEVAKRTVASFKELLDEVKKKDERVKKDLLAKLKQALQSESGNSGE